MTFASSADFFRSPKPEVPVDPLAVRKAFDDLACLCPDCANGEVREADRVRFGLRLRFGVHPALVCNCGLPAQRMVNTDLGNELESDDGTHVSGGSGCSTIRAKIPCNDN